MDNTQSAETLDNEERGDICMELRALGHDEDADEVGGMTVEDARLSFMAVTGLQWHWEPEGFMDESPLLTWDDPTE